MAVPPPASTRATVCALLALTVVSGLVDAVTYLRLGHVFAANMTGNVVFLGFGIDPGSGVDPVASVVAIGGFVVGALIGGRAGALLSGRPDRWLGSAFGFEAGLLAVVALLVGLGVLDATGPHRLIVVLLLALAFGVQNATVRRLGSPDITTTVLTLTLTGIAADSVLAGGSGARSWLRSGSIVAMLGGAALGAILLAVTLAGVLWLAAVVVLGAALVFAVRSGARASLRLRARDAARAHPPALPPRGRAVRRRRASRAR